jgi:hypothetical protein
MNNDNTACAKCGQPIIDESPSSDPENRKPCPNCGSLARAFSVHVQGAIALSGSVAQAELITYPQTLLSTARNLMNDGQFSISVVVAHMACEIATERTLSQAFAKNNIQYLEESITDFLNGYNLASDRNRKLYTSLTGDEIQNQPFWQQFKESAKRRNEIVHQGKIAKKAEAEESFKAANDLITYLKK